ncbi:hypothetical protein K501DRAFT_284172 [Backusella circina FSU 941]|nr:hypothetical protein K501DRAFT_284172 [Backusella circina FSU 941]
MDLIKGHLHSLTTATLLFLFKDNNISLLLNLLYHSTRVKLIHTHNKRSTRDRGILHLGLALLSMLALGKRKRVSKRSAFFVLSLSSMGHVLNAHHHYADIMVSLTSLAGWSVCVQQTGRFF